MIILDFGDKSKEIFFVEPEKDLNWKEYNTWINKENVINLNWLISIWIIKLKIKWSKQINTNYKILYILYACVTSCSSHRNISVGFTLGWDLKNQKKKKELKLKFKNS